MQKAAFFGRGLMVAATLFVFASSASAAPARRHKPKRPAPVAATPPAHDDGSDTQSAQPASAQAAQVKPNESTPTQSEAETVLPPEAPRVTASASLGAPHEVTPDQAAANTREADALGRREAARLAAGRIEVGVSASVDVGNRRFRYSDALGTLPRPYKLPIAPMASFGLEAYPLASSNLPVLRDLGFRGYFSRAFAVASNTPDGAKIETRWTRFGGEVRERLLVPGRQSLELGAYVGADASYFVMTTRSTVLALLPTARTLSIRFGLDSRFRMAGPFSLLLGAAYLAATSPGEIYARFRDPNVAGIDAALGCTVALTPGLEARLLGRYTRYFASFKPQVGDPLVAGGALDEQLQFGLGVRYAH